MPHRQASDAGQRFGELVNAATVDGPQVVVRHERPVAVILSPIQYGQLVQQANANFGRFLASSPFGPEDTELVGMTLAACM